MRGATKLPVKNIMKQLYPMQSTKRPMMISAPNRNDTKNEQGSMLVPVDNMSSVAIFDKPKLPPVLGPLVLLSLLEIASSGDDHDK